MKKTLCTLAVIGLAVSSFAQGYVTVAGTGQNSTNNTTITTSWTGGSAAGGGALGATSSGQSYKLALLTTTSGSATTALFGSGAGLSTWSDTGLLGGNNTFAGRLTIGSSLATANGTAAVGNTQTWLLVAWSTSLGANWAAVAPKIAAGDFNGSAGFLGWSLTGSGAASAAPPALSLVIQGTGAIIPGTFSLLAVPVAPVPEPGTMALAALGGASLLLFRRRK